MPAFEAGELAEAHPFRVSLMFIFFFFNQAIQIIDVLSTGSWPMGV